MTRSNDYKQKQLAAREIERVAAMERQFTLSSFELMYDCFGRFLQKIQALDCFAAQVAKTVYNSMNVYGRLARVSSKQAWILACAAVENNIEL